MGKYQAWVAAENVLGREVEAIAEGIGSPAGHLHRPPGRRRRQDPRQAREAGIDARAVDVPTDGTAGASFQGKDTGGTSRLVVDEARETIVGATFTGFETADFLQAATVAIVGEVPLPRLRHAVAAYPTRSEIWLKLLEEYEPVAPSRRVERRFRSSSTSCGKPGTWSRSSTELKRAEPLAVGEQAGRLGDREVLGRAAARR